MDDQVYTVADHVFLWIADRAAVHIKTQEPYGDPVELSEEDALELAAILNKLVQDLRGGT